MTSSTFGGRWFAAPYSRDRNQGQALPSGLTDEGYTRIRAAVDRRQQARRLVPTTDPPAVTDPWERRRFATLDGIERAGFRRVASGMFREPGAEGGGVGGRTAHPIWELRRAEEGDGYELVRRREERAVDLRQAGAGTAAAVAAGIVRTAQAQPPKGPSRCGETEWHDPSRCYYCQRAMDKKTTAAIDPARDFRRRGGPAFLVSLLQTPGGDLSARRTLFANQEMDLEGLERLIGELKAGPMSVTHDTWTDGEWEVRVRGPRGQLIHAYDSVGADEIGGEKGRTLLETLTGVMGGGEEMPPPTADGEGGELDMAEAGAAAAEAGGAMGEDAASMPPPNALAPSAAAIRQGQCVRFVRRGQIADAVVVMIRPQEHALDVLFGGGETGVVSMGDLVDPIVELDETDEPADDEAAPTGDDTIVEVHADDFAGAGGASHDPFDAFGRDAALMRRWAIDFGSAFRPGGRVQATQAFRSHYERTPVRAGEVFVMEGFHRGVQDAEYGFGGLADPQPGGDPFENIRVRLVSETTQQPLLVSVDELDRFFAAPQREQNDETAVPEMPGESVYGPGGGGDESSFAPTFVRPRVDQPGMRPPAAPGSQTNVGRPARV